MKTGVGCSDADQDQAAAAVEQAHVSGRTSKVNVRLQQHAVGSQ